MKMTTFLDELNAQNVSVYLKDGKVKVKGNRNILKDDFLLELKARKAEILEYLTKPKSTEDVRQTLNSFIWRGVIFYPSESDAEVENADLLTQAEKRFLTENKTEVLYLIQRASIMHFCNAEEKDQFLFEINERLSLGGDESALMITTRNYFAQIWK